jgi:hypothetical protein
LVVIDSAAAVFDGEAITRRQVRGFLSMLRKIARKHETAIMLLDHPSVGDGTGTANSVDWRNSARAMLHLSDPNPSDPDERTLGVKKNNRGRVGEKTTLRWNRLTFTTDQLGLASPRRLAAERSQEAAIERAKALAPLFEELQGKPAGPRDRAHPERAQGRHDRQAVVCGDCDPRARAIDDRRLIFDFDPIPIRSAHLCVARRRQRTPYSHRPRPSRAASSGKFGLGPQSQMRLILQEVIFCIWVPTFTQALPLGDPEKPVHAFSG